MNQVNLFHLSIGADMTFAVAAPSTLLIRAAEPTRTFSLQYTSMNAWNQTENEIIPIIKVPTVFRQTPFARIVCVLRSLNNLEFH